MTSRLVTYWRNTEEMPAVLRILCQGGMIVGPVFLVALATWR